MSYTHRPFYRTAPAPSDAEAKARTQDEQILDLFRKMPAGSALSPETIHQMIFGPRVPLTSVRRSISNLTAAGQLERTDTTVTSSYGRPVHLWRLAPDPGQLGLFQRAA